MFASSHIAHSSTFRRQSFKAFKSSFNKAYSNYMKQSSGWVITTNILASLVGQAFPNAFTPVNVLSGFNKTGIYPFNPSAVDDRQLAPSNAVSKKSILCHHNLFQKMTQSHPLSHRCFFHQRRKSCLQRGLKKTMTSKIPSILHGSKLITLNAA